MDLNRIVKCSPARAAVPPRKGRVDLNTAAIELYGSYHVPPRKGRVDLNIEGSFGLLWMKRPAPQGAGGFKFCRETPKPRPPVVPPRKGRVDLNLMLRAAPARSGGPAPQGAGGFKYPPVVHGNAVGRPAPQGAGGFKFRGVPRRPGALRSRPARGGWI